MKNVAKTFAILFTAVVILTSCDGRGFEGLDDGPRGGNNIEQPGDGPNYDDTDDQGNGNSDGNSGSGNSNTGGTNNGNDGSGIGNAGGTDSGNSGDKDDNGNGGNKGGLHADVPVISGLTYLRTESCNGGEKKVFRNTSDDYHATIEAYANALRNAGFTRVGTTNGGGWGPYGGRQAYGYKGSKYVKINAQVQQNTGSVVYVCAWASEPWDDNCDDD